MKKITFLISLFSLFFISNRLIAQTTKTFFATTLEHSEFSSSELNEVTIKKSDNNSFKLDQIVFELVDNKLIKTINDIVTLNNNSSGISDTNFWSFTTNETVKPTLVSLSPLDEATNINPTTDLILTFDEDISKGIGNITINDDINSVIISTLDVATSTNITVSGKTLTISGITLPERDDVYILIDNGAIKDVNGNSFEGISVKTMWNFKTGDITSPIITISSTNSVPTNQNIAAKFTFNEDVTGFDISDIIVGNGTVSNFVAVDKKVYTATVTPIADGEVTIDVNADVAKDDFDNNNLAATQFKITYDTTRPTVSISADKNNTTNVPFTSTFTFSEDVVKFNINHIIVNNATVSNFTIVSAKEYTAKITPTNQGNVTVDIPENVAQDAVKNKNTAAIQFAILYDSIIPTVALSSSVATNSNNTFNITATFSEDVTGFDINDFTLTNATASNFTTVNAKVYTAKITPTTDGDVTVDINANVAQDVATNQNSSANQIKTKYDGTIPTVTLSSSIPSNTNINNFNVNIKFSEDVTGFDINKITLTNATATNFTIVSANEFTAKITAITEGELTVDVKANVAQDIATNQNTAANKIKTNYDATKPTINISSTAPNPTNSEFTTSFTFSEDITGFDINDITLNNATASNFTTVNPKEYSAIITPTSNGEVTINVNAGVVQDAATNLNTAATQFKIVYDGTTPEAPIITGLSDYTCSGNTNYTADQTLIISGTAEANTRVVVLFNLVPQGSVIADGSGNWTFDNTSVVLPDEVYIITANTTDSANNTSLISNQFYITVSTSDNDNDNNPNFCDDDDDNDGVLDVDDNSPLIPNPGQEDSDGDGIPDVEEDCDNDGIINYYDTDNSSCTKTIAQKKKYGFSPNGDGINDTWTIESIELYPGSVVKVYNRSGRLVYREYGYKNNWNGISNKIDGNNKKLPAGPYLFIIELNKDNQKPIQGWLYINY